LTDCVTQAPSNVNPAQHSAAKVYKLRLAIVTTRKCMPIHQQIKTQQSHGWKCKHNDATVTRNTVRRLLH